MGITVLSLFDGISCGQLALQKAGIEVDTYYASEIDRYAIEVTKYNFPNTLHLGDVTKWETWQIDWSSIDLLIGGSPCQGFSFAGKQLAFTDPRSRLFFEYVNILNHIRKFNPNVKFLLENVNMKKEYINVISEYLGVVPVLINSSRLSAQNRQRWYWGNYTITQPEDKGIIISDILEEEVDEKYYVNKKLADKYLGGNQLNPRYKSQANTIHNINGKSETLCAGTHGYANGYIIVKNRIRRFTPIEFERLQTVTDNYTIAISDTQRYKCLGNGWTVDVISHIFKSL